jgi:capsular exopolysaccharide synthesis family protein
VRDDQLYQNLMTRFVDVRAQLAQARAVYGDENSNVKRLQDEGAELAAQVESERARMVNRVRTSFAAALAREQMMTTSREKLRAEMGDASSHLVTYRMLKNEAVANAELYNTLQGRLKEAGIYAGLKSSNIHIVDLAPKLARPTGPHRTLIIGAGAMLSCMFALILPFIRESLDHTVRTPGDIKETIGLATLAMIPRMNGKWAGPPRPVLPLGELNGGQGKLPMGNSATGIPLIRPLTPESEAIRDLRTGILLANSEIAPRVVLVSSPTAGEGKTTVAVNLAIVLAQNGKTCLVEGDLRRPKAMTAFGLRSKTGISSVLESGTPLSSALANLPEFPTLTVLAAGPPSRNPGDLIASGQMIALVTALRDEFDYVVIDSPPIIPFSDARTLSRLVDAVVLVGRYGVTTRRSMERSVELLDEVRAPILGAVLNDIDLSSADYHYFNYGYSRKVGAARQDYDVNELPASAAASQSGDVNKKGAHA